MGAGSHPPPSPPAAPVLSACTCRRWGGLGQNGMVWPPHPLHALPPPALTSSLWQSRGQWPAAGCPLPPGGRRGTWGSGQQPPARPLQHSVGWGSVMRLGGGPSPPMEPPAPPWSPQPHPYPRHHQWCHHRRARVAVWPHSRRDHPQQGTAGDTGGGTVGILGGGAEGGVLWGSPTQRHGDTIPTCEL